MTWSQFCAAAADDDDDDQFFKGNHGKQEAGLNILSMPSCCVYRFRKKRWRGSEQLS